MLSFAFLALALTTSALPLSSNCIAGDIVCNGPTQFAICNPPQTLEFGPVAEGTMCVNGAIQQGAASGSAAASAYSTETTAAAILPTSSSASTVTVTSIATVTVLTSSSTPTISSTPASSSVSAPAYSSPAASSTASSSAAPAATGTYITYTGSGSVSAGWPALSDWVSWDTLITANTPTLKTSCGQFNQPNDSDQEIADIKSAIQSTANTSGVDARFIFAIMLQESKGCVRVPQTNYGVQNPGLFQSHAGTGQCSTYEALDGKIITAGIAQSPCPASQITQMVHDGVLGTSTGAGLQQLIQQAGTSDVSKYYRAARIYNSGSIPASDDLSAAGATASYASDIANRLTGALTTGSSGFTSG